MGQIPSSRRDQTLSGERPRNAENLEGFMQPITSKESLQSKYALYLAYDCLGHEESVYLTHLFDRHCSEDTENHEKYWTENTFAGVLSQIITTNCPILLLDTSSLYNLLLRLGSFPYLMDTAPRLNFQVFSTALILLSGRFAKRQHAENRYEWYRRVIFQSFATKLVTLDDNSVTRTDEDEDLNAALAYLSDNRWKRPNPCLTPYRAPPLPPASSLPSSFSKRLDGTIPTKSIEALLRSLMILRLRHHDLHIEDTLEHDQGLKKAMESILATVQTQFGLQVQVDFEWQQFDYLFKEVAPYAISYLPCLMEIFFSPLSPSSPKNAMGLGVFSTYYQERRDLPTSQQPKYSNINTFIPALHNHSSLLTSPHLAQILFALETLDSWQQHQLQCATFLKGKMGTIMENIGKLKRLDRHEMLILVSGSHFASADESAPSVPDIICGAFLRQERGPSNSHITTTELTESIIFALEPLSYSSEVGRGLVEQTRAGGEVGWAIRVEAGGGVLSTLSFEASGTVTRSSLVCGSQDKVDFRVQRLEVLVLGLWPVT